MVNVFLAMIFAEFTSSANLIYSSLKVNIAEGSIPIRGVISVINSLKIDEDTKRVQVFLNPEEVSKAIGRGGHNIRLAGKLTGYEIDVYREGVEEDVELTEFTDEIDAWVIEEFKKVGLDTAKSILELDTADLVKRTDLEEETVAEVIRILKAEFEE